MQGDASRPSRSAAGSNSSADSGAGMVRGENFPLNSSSSDSGTNALNPGVWGSAPFQTRYSTKLKNDITECVIYELGLIPETLECVSMADICGEHDPKRSTSFCQIVILIYLYDCASRCFALR